MNPTEIKAGDFVVVDPNGYRAHNIGRRWTAGKHYEVVDLYGDGTLSVVSDDGVEGMISIGGFLPAPTPHPTPATSDTRFEDARKRAEEFLNSLPYYDDLYKNGAMDGLEAAFGLKVKTVHILVED